MADVPIGYSSMVTNVHRSFDVHLNVGGRCTFVRQNPGHGLTANVHPGAVWNIPPGDICQSHVLSHEPLGVGTNEQSVRGGVRIGVEEPARWRKRVRWISFAWMTVGLDGTSYS